VGYTHYASRPKTLPLRKFKAAALDCRKAVEALCEEHGFQVQWESDDQRPPCFDQNGIRFNGVSENGHETFAVDRVYQPYPEQRKPSRGEGWGEFTKTARKPYDAAVCACLIVFNHHFGKSYPVGSDGDDDDEGWVAARKCCQRVLGYGADFTLKAPPRMTIRGLAYAGGWFDSSYGGKARNLSNGWQICKPRTAGAKCTVHNPYLGESTEGVIASGDTAPIAIWRATVAFFQVEFNEAPFLDEFADSMRMMPGEWSSFLAWSDKLQDHGHDDLAKKVRDHLPL